MMKYHKINLDVDLTFVFIIFQEIQSIFDKTTNFTLSFHPQFIPTPKLLSIVLFNQPHANFKTWAYE